MSAAPCASSRRTSTSSPAASDSRWTLALAQLSGHLTPRRSSVSRAMLHPARCGRRRGHPARGQVVEPGGDRRLELVDRTARRRRQPGEPGELRAGRDALAVAVRPRRPVRVGREPRHGPPRAVQPANPSSPMEPYALRPRPDARPDDRYRIDYAGELNRAQYEAATTLEGPVLVIAGAGSGKTRTLVYRVARLVESGVNPGQVLLLTFTRRAAEEMLRRAAALGGASCERVAGR